MASISLVADKGDVITATVRFRDEPSAVSISTTSPSGTVTTVVYPTDVTKTAPKTYEYDFEATEEGTWTVKAVASGTFKAVAFAQMKVNDLP